MTTEPFPPSTGVSRARIKVLVVDDHLIVRNGLAQLIASSDLAEQVGSVGNG